jgi:hypothetical protein
MVFLRHDAPQPMQPAGKKINWSVKSYFP